MSRNALGASACLATGTGIVGAIASLGGGILPIGMILVIATFGSIAIHAVLNPQSYGHPHFTGAFYRVWGIAVPLLVAAVLATSAFSPEAAKQLAYWSGFAAVALFAGAVVRHRTAAVPGR